MGILNKDLLERVDDLKTRIDSSKLETFAESIFERVSRQVLAHAPIQDADNQRRGIEVVNNFQVAWDYASRNYPGSFNLPYLQEIAGRVEPNLRSPLKTYADFRKDSVRLLGYDFIPPTDESKIRDDLEKVIRSIERTGLHPLEEALFLYLNLARIQPFQNGNKRVSNIVMNVGLLREGFSPIPIPTNEEDLFKQYFEGALYGFQEDNQKAGYNSLRSYLDPGIEQRQFYSYLAEREERALSRVVDRLKGLNQYMITFEAKSPNSAYLLKKQISGWFHRDKETRPFKGTIDVKKGTLELVGEIPLITLKKILECSKKRGIRSYKIAVKGLK